jgi:hypothetical protein
METWGNTNTATQSHIPEDLTAEHFHFIATSGVECKQNTAQ